MALDERVTQAVRQALGHERDVVMSARSGTAEQRGSVVRRLCLIFAGLAATRLAFTRGRGTSPGWVGWMLAGAATFFAASAAAAPKAARVVADRIGSEDEAMSDVDEPMVAHEGNGGVPVGAR